MTASGVGRRFEAVVIDWDGTAVPDRRADATELRAVVEAATAHGLHVGIVSGTHLDNVDEQLMARPTRPGSLHLCLNRGSEVFEVGTRGPRLVWRRRASTTENGLLDAAAEAAADELAKRGLAVQLVGSRLNRRKLDLIPEAEWADPPKAEIAGLLAVVTARLHAVHISGLGEAVSIVRAAAAGTGLKSPCVTTDAKHIEIGLTDKADSARWLAGYLWKRGVHSTGVLLIGDELGTLGGVPGSDALMMVPELEGATVVSVGREPEGVPAGVTLLGGGPGRCLRALQDQVRRRHDREVPEPPNASGWIIEASDASPLHPAAASAVCALADGIVGTVGLGGDPAALVLAQGEYVGTGPDTELLQCPIWQVVADIPAAGRVVRRTLDLHTGSLWYTIRNAGHERVAVAFQSRRRAATGVIRQELPAKRPQAPLLVAPTGRPASERRRAESATMTVGGHGAGVEARATRRGTPSGATADSFAVYRTARAGTRRGSSTASALRRAREAGFDHLLNEHRDEWARRWADADVEIDAPGDLQTAVRFALYHLMASARSTGEAAVAARGLTGEGYRGHVFWDADVFVLPFLAATHAPSARAMLQYRIQRLGAARRRALSEGRRGARFPWESAATGEDVTPRSARDPITGGTVAIHTGDLEEHIVSDVAWAASCYVDWSGDDDFWHEGGADLVIEAARYWTSRARRDGDGRAHIDRVIGPDEYHLPVDDNAFTNVMARWTLRRAATLHAAVVQDGEREAWHALADALVDGYREEDGVYEQFDGFAALEPLIIRDIAPRRPIAADLLLGPERVAGAQVLKQADALMLHYLLPDDVAPGSLIPNLDYYEPRTAHGSSLSPGVHASLLARAGRTDAAMAALDVAARIDLDDLTGTTSSGLHLAAMGTVWHAITHGVLGIRATADCLRVDPHLPRQWRQARAYTRYRGVRVAVEAFQGGVRIVPERATTVSIGGMSPVTVPGGGLEVSIPTGGLDADGAAEEPRHRSGSAPMAAASARSTMGT